MQVVLVMFRGESGRRSFSIARDVSVVGRREDCDFRIPLGEISRKHCRLIRDGENLRVEDLGSSNGTFVNGERVQEAVLQPGDTLQMGSVVFVVQIDGVPTEDEMHPVAPTRLEPAAQEDQPSGTLGGEIASTESLAPAEPLSVEEALASNDSVGHGKDDDDEGHRAGGKVGAAAGEEFPHGAGGSEAFDPMAVLGGTNDDSIGSAPLDGSQMADELMNDLARTQAKKS